MATYNSELFCITSMLALCGDEKVKDTNLVEKTLSMFHSSNLILTMQYRNLKFQQYMELISVTPRENR